MHYGEGFKLTVKVRQALLTYESRKRKTAFVDVQGSVFLKYRWIRLEIVDKGAGCQHLQMDTSKRQKFSYGAIKMRFLGSDMSATISEVSVTPNLPKYENLSSKDKSATPQVRWQQLEKYIDALTDPGWEVQNLTPQAEGPCTTLHWTVKRPK